MKVQKERRKGLRTTAVLVRMSEREKALLAERAQALGRPLSTYLREAGLR